jgi:hypothetical protein
LRGDRRASRLCANAMGMPIRSALLNS